MKRILIGITATILNLSFAEEEEIQHQDDSPAPILNERQAPASGLLGAAQAPPLIQFSTDQSLLQGVIPKASTDLNKDKEKKTEQEKVAGTTSETRDESGNNWKVKTEELEKTDKDKDKLAGDSAKTLDLEKKDSKPPEIVPKTPEANTAKTAQERLTSNSGASPKGSTAIGPTPQPRQAQNSAPVQGEAPSTQGRNLGQPIVGPNQAVQESGKGLVSTKLGRSQSSSNAEFFTVVRDKNGNEKPGARISGGALTDGQDVFIIPKTTKEIVRANVNMQTGRNFQENATVVASDGKTFVGGNQIDTAPTIGFTITSTSGARLGMQNDNVALSKYASGRTRQAEAEEAGGYEAVNLSEVAYRLLADGSADLGYGGGGKGMNGMGSSGEKGRGK